VHHVYVTVSALVGSSAKGMWVHAAGADTATVRLVGKGLDATATVYAHNAVGFDGLADYFSDLSNDWRGWQGARAWRSLEGELTLAATHDGHVHVEVRLQDSAYANWTVETTLTLDAGEQLARTASDLRALVG
jgi:hypothetical protein